MSEPLHVELSQQDRDVLLRGLRFVRSAIMLECREPTPEDTRQRRDQLEHIGALVEQLGGTPSAQTAGV